MTITGIVDAHYENNVYRQNNVEHWAINWHYTSHYYDVLASLYYCFGWVSSIFMVLQLGLF